MNVIAVDVGTASVRLAIISFSGSNYRRVDVLASHKQGISYHQDGLTFMQKSDEIWNTICSCSKACILKSSIQPQTIEAIAFSATCSLVVYQQENRSDNLDIIMWMDHRAIPEASAISSSGSAVLQQFGGACSPEFSLSKLLWLKKNDPDRLQNASGLFELPDWLVYKCIGGSTQSSPRSLCCVTCKWGYNVDRASHDSLITQLDSNVGQRVLGPGQPAGWLDHKAAIELGIVDSSLIGDHISSRVVVGTSLIDAHSGMVAMLSVPLDNYAINLDIETSLCSLAGTSSCHMLLSREPKFHKGIWGPYRDVIIQGYFLSEAGQSLTGRLIELCIESNLEGANRLHAGESVYDVIQSLNQAIRSKERDFVLKDTMHVLPTYHGNRSPMANPQLRGGIYGLRSEGNLTLLDQYVATVESIAYEVKMILNHLEVESKTILVSGGLMKNTFYMQTLADVTGCQVVKLALSDIDFMVMGSAITARHAAIQRRQTGNGGEPLTAESIESMCYNKLDTVIYRPDLRSLDYHDKKYLCYREFVDLSLKIDMICSSA